MTKHHGPQEVHLAHSWQGGVIALSKTKRAQNADTYALVEIGASRMGLVPGGLLSAVLDDAPCPLHESSAYRLKAVLRFAATDSRARAILNAPPGQLVAEDIHYLFEVFERLATQSSKPTAVQLPKSAIGVFRRCTAELQNKQTIADVEFRSAIPNSTHQTKCLSEFHDDGIDDEHFRPPLHVCIAGMPRERTKDFIRAHLQARKNRVLNICGAILRKHRNWAAELRTLKTAPPPGIKNRLLTTIKNGGTTGAEALEKLDSTQRLYLAAQIAENRARQAYTIASPPNSVDSSTKTPS